MRKFAVVKGKENEDINLPQRSTNHSAGYDIEASEDTLIMPYSHSPRPAIVKTGIKAYMEEDEVLQVYVRSSSAIKKFMTMPNNVGIIDSDYADNPDNDGEIGIPLWNFGYNEYLIKKGERIAQGVFTKFLTTDDDEKHIKKERVGGTGSTGN